LASEEHLLKGRRECRIGWGSLSRLPEKKLTSEGVGEGRERGKLNPFIHFHLDSSEPKRGRGRKGTKRFKD